jgi:protein-arginine kinase activator protein McsA
MPSRNYTMLCETCKKKHNRFWVTRHISVLKKGDGTIAVICDQCGSTLRTDNEHFYNHYTGEESEVIRDAVSELQCQL